MHFLAAGVKPLPAGCWATISIRTLYTVAAYHGLEIGHRHSKAQLAQTLIDQLYTELPAAYLASRLTAADQTLLAQVAAGDLPPLDRRTLRWPWQLRAPRPCPVDLQPLERLLAYGFVLPLRRAGQCVLWVPPAVAQALTALTTPLPTVPRVLPPAPTLTDLVDDAVTILAELAVAPPRHHPGDGLAPPVVRRLARHGAPWPVGLQRRYARVRWLHLLLHQADLLTHSAGCCTLTATVPVFLAQTPGAQAQTLLRAWATVPLSATALPGDLRPADLDWPALLRWLWARLAALPPQAIALTDLTAAWATGYGALLQPPLLRSPLRAAVPAGADAALLRALLAGPLTLWGFVQSDGRYLAPSPSLPADPLGAFTVPTAGDPPQLAGLTITVPAGTAAALRMAVTPWTQHTRTAAGHCYTFTPTTLAQGAQRLGSYRPLRDLLTRHFPAVPTALARLLAAHTGLPPQPRRPAARPPTGCAAAPSPDNVVHLILALRCAAAVTPDYALRFAQLAADGTADLSLAQRADLEDLWERLESPLPAEEPLIAAAARPAPAAALPLRHALLAAIAAAVPVRIRYYTAGRGVISWRVIHPLTLDPPYLTAFCRRRAADRVFRLDRILACEPVAGHALLPPPAPAWPVTPPAPPPVPPAVGLRPDYGEVA